MQSGAFRRFAAALLGIAATVPAVAGTAPRPHGAAAVASSLPASRADSIVVDTTQTSSTFLGFELGEERRYALGPPELLYAGEQAIWSVRLAAILAEPPDAVFELSHSWQRYEASSSPPVGTITRIDSHGELRANAHGFPLEVSFDTSRRLAGLGEERYTIRYRFEDGEYRKHVVKDGNDLEHRVRLRRNDELDLGVPTGLYAFSPAPLECALAPPRFSREPASGSAAVRSPPTGAASGMTRLDRDGECLEQLFGNPGLLSLLLPALWEAGTGTLEFVVLTPRGPFGMPGWSAGGGSRRSSSGGSSPGTRGVSGGKPADHFDAELAMSPRVNSDVEELRYVDRVRVEVGRRTRDAWLFEGMRLFDRVYVDDDGVVLRADLAARMGSDAPVDLYSAQGPTRMDTRELWIRLLYSSEY